jgi:hypothetical protein
MIGRQSPKNPISFPLAPVGDEKAARPDEYLMTRDVAPGEGLRVSRSLGLFRASGYFHARIKVEQSELARQMYCRLSSTMIDWNGGRSPAICRRHGLQMTRTAWNP